MEKELFFHNRDLRNRIRCQPLTPGWVGAYMPAHIDQQSSRAFTDTVISEPHKRVFIELLPPTTNRCCIVTMREAAWMKQLFPYERKNLPFWLSGFKIVWASLELIFNSRLHK
ncbi:MAG: hypothetical protein OEV08_14525 [Nitrospira sp.]|nr:hypothetical protein [Nitrospira sp.]